MRRIALAVLLTAALAGCATVRKGLGEYQKAADKGVNIGGPPVDGGGDVASTYVGARGGSGTDAGGGKANKLELPGGLGGDKAHAQYTSPPQG
jgi:predicted small secreted protein